MKRRSGRFAAAARVPAFGFQIRSAATAIVAAWNTQPHAWKSVVEWIRVLEITSWVFLGSYGISAMGDSLERMMRAP